MHARPTTIQVENKSLSELIAMRRNLRKRSCCSLSTLEEAFVYLSNLNKVNNAIQKLENPNTDSNTQLQQKEFSKILPERFERAQKIKDSLEFIKKGLHGLHDAGALSENGEVLLDDVDALMQLYQTTLPSKIISFRLTEYLITNETKAALVALSDFKRRTLTTQLLFCVSVAYDEAKASLNAVPTYTNKENDIARLDDIHMKCLLRADAPSADEITPSALTELFEFIDLNRNLLKDKTDAQALRCSNAALMKKHPRDNSDTQSAKQSKFNMNP